MGETIVPALVGSISALVVNFLIQKATDNRFEAELKSRYELASLDKRLQAHQEAFALWWKLTQNLSAEKVWDTTEECRDWWVNNNLYLRDDARVAFWESFNAAQSRQQDLDWASNDLELRKQVTDSIKINFDKIYAAGEVIEKSIGYIHRNPSLPKEMTDKQ